MLEIRDGTPEETAAVAPPREGIETWMGVLEEHGIPVGRICVSRALGAAFGHDTVCHSEDVRGAAMLWLAARRKVREWGLEEVQVHFEKEEDPMIEFWKGRGFARALVVYRGRV